MISFDWNSQDATDEENDAFYSKQRQIRTTLIYEVQISFPETLSWETKWSSNFWETALSAQQLYEYTHGISARVVVRKIRTFSFSS